MRLPPSLVRRLTVTPLLLLGVAALTLHLPELTGTDAVRATQRARTADAAPDPETAARLTAELGTDRSLPVRLAAYVGALARGEMGTSTVTRTPVAGQVGGAAAVSGTLLAIAMTAALAIGVPLGLASAVRPSGVADRITTGIARLAVAVPEYVVAPVLVLVVAVWWRALPSAGWSGPRHAVLPAACLALFPLGIISQLVRAEASSVVHEPFVRTARAAGLSRARVLCNHIGRVSLVATVAVASSFTAGLIGGAVMVEVIFGIPGMGRLLHNAVTDVDIPVLQGGLLVVVAAALALGAMADAAHDWLDPRARLR